jgi:hypothetical protein
MKKRTIVILCGTVLFVSLFILINYFVPLKYIFSSESVGRYEISAMRESKLNHESSVILVSNDTDFQFPLPNGAVSFDNSIYPIRENNWQYLITVESYQYYLHEQLPQLGFEVDQMGSWVTISNTEYQMQIGMSAAMFTRNFMRVEFSIMP